MAWDSSRPVPWGRLVREWAVYAAIMAVVFALFFRDSIVGASIGLLVSGPLYLALGALLAKLGYQRKTLKQLRAARSAGVPRGGDAPVQPTAGAPRQRPAPTRRTSGGGRSNRPSDRRR